MAKRWLPLVLAAGWLALAAQAQGQEQEPAEPSSGAPRLQAQGEYLFLWMKSASFPVVASTGKNTDQVPGALGQPGTSVLIGGNESHGQIPAGRLTLTYWLADPKVFGIQGNFFVAGQETVSDNFVSDGGPKSQVLARPFFNPVANREDADPRALPGVLAGNINFNYMTRLMGGEVNGLWNIGGGDVYQGFNIGLIGGVRYLRLDEKYYSNDQTVELPLGQGDTFKINDNFTTYNQFVGPQVGSMVKFRFDGNLAFDVISKIAAGPNFETQQIGGFTSIIGPNGALIASGKQGLYAQPSNIGHFRHTPVTVLPEIACNFRWEITSYCHFNVGYTFLYLDKVIRPGDQIDRVVNIQAVGAPQSQPARPIPMFHETSFWVQFAQLGVQFNY
jgi:hypothetical protein